MKRRGALVRPAAVIVVLGLGLGACDARRPEPGPSRLRSATPPERRAVPRPVDPDGGVRVPYVIGLPPEGIAVEEGDAVLLLSVRGEALQRLDGFGIASSPSGDVVLRRRRGGDLWAVNPVLGTLERRRSVHDAPLAYGARLVHQDSGVRVEQGGRVLVEAEASTVQVSYDRDIVTSSGEGGVVAHDLRTGRQRHLPDGCHVADRHGPAWYLACDAVDAEHIGTRIARLDPDGREVALARGEGFGWITVMVSPGGDRFAAVGDYDCGGPHVDLGSTDRPGIRTLGEVIGAAEDPNAAPLGWTLSGTLLFDAASSCGPPLQGLGVYALEGDRTRAVYLPPDPEAEWLAVAVWTLLPGETYHPTLRDMSREYRG